LGFLQYGEEGLQDMQDTVQEKEMYERSKTKSTIGPWLPRGTESIQKIYERPPRQTRCIGRQH
jgi:hypothetical protein